MNIRDVELRTGLERANVRYYEKEGLLNPSRLSNGYRDYSEADVETLLRIKLLRELEVSVAEIVQLQTNEAALQDVIASRLENLQKERAVLARERKICETMQLDGAVYETLKAERYLQQLEDLRRQDWGVDSAAGWPGQTEHLKEDVAPLDLRPAERLVARMVDILFYQMLWLFLYYRVIQIPFSRDSNLIWMHMMFAFLLQLFLEPTLISCLGGTLGHFIIGMRVHTYQGGKVSWEQAVGRLWIILWKAPMIVSRRPLWLSDWYNDWYGDYWPLNKDSGFPWDEDTTYSFLDEKGWRPVALAGCGMVLGLVIGLIFSGAQQLKHQGPMTLAEFAENYNKYVELEGRGFNYVLDSQGRWEKAFQGHVIVNTSNSSWSDKDRFPQLTYTEEDGYLTGITFELHHQGEAGKSIPGSQRLITDLVMSYAVPYVGHQSADLIEAEIAQNHMRSHTMQMRDLDISWEVKTIGYAYDDVIGVFKAMSYSLKDGYSYHMIFQIRPADRPVTN